MNIEFKFEIGDVVTTKAMLFLCDKTCQAFAISERYVQQCEGGIQLHYRLRAVEPPSGFDSHRPSQVTHWPGESAMLAHCLPEGELCLFPESSKAIYGGDREVRRQRIEEAKAEEAKGST